MEFEYYNNHGELKYSSLLPSILCSLDTYSAYGRLGILLCPITGMLVHVPSLG